MMPDRPRIILLLALSLGCNSLLGGFVLTQQARAYLAQPGPQSALETGPLHPAAAIREMIAQLPPADAEIMRSAVRENITDIRTARQQALDALRHARGELLRQPENATALRQAIASLGEARRQVADVVERVLEPTFDHISPEGRHMLADFWVRR